MVGNHTWSHPSLTGKSTGTRPLTQAQVREQLSRANAAIVMAGASSRRYGARRTAA